MSQCETHENVGDMEVKTPKFQRCLLFLLIACPVLKGTTVNTSDWQQEWLEKKGREDARLVLDE